MAPQLLEPFTLGYLIVLTIIARSLATSYFYLLFNRPPKTVRKTQFTLTDLYILILQFGMTAAVSIDIHLENDLIENVLGILILWAFQSLWWYWGIRALSVHEIRDPLRRLAVLGIVCPCAFSWPLLSTGVGVGGLIFCFAIVLFILLFYWLIFVALSRLVVWIVQETPATPYPNRRAGWALCIIFYLCTTPAATAPFWSGIVLQPIYYTIHTLRLRQQMRWTADIPAIQEWMKSINISQNHEDGGGSTKQLPKLPRCIRDLSNLQLSEARPFVTREGTLVLSWGSGFGHWGLEVAPKGSKIPEMSSSRYSLPLTDGAWVWSDDH